MKPLNMEVTNRLEQWRAETALTKEPGTLKWLEANVRAGDVVYDIGANVGIYTMMACQLVNDSGRVYAFEPHIPTAKALLTNLSVNAWGNRATVITSALHSEQGFFPFHYSNLKSGSSGHQVKEPVDEFGRPFTPAATELKQCTTVDYLLRKKAIEPANLIKLDVDGNEFEVLKGMEGWLQAAPGLRSIQVEVHEIDEIRVRTIMERYGFHLTERHYTQYGQEALNQGFDPKRISHNAVYHKL